MKRKIITGVGKIMSVRMIKRFILAIALMSSTMPIFALECPNAEKIKNFVAGPAWYPDTQANWKIIKRNDDYRSIEDCSYLEVVLAAGKPVRCSYHPFCIKNNDTAVVIESIKNAPSEQVPSIGKNFYTSLLSNMGIDEPKFDFLEEFMSLQYLDRFSSFPVGISCSTTADAPKNCYVPI